MAKIEISASDFPSNNGTEKKEEQHKFEKVVQGPVKVKKSVGRKMADIFLGAEVADVKHYVLYDLLIPGVKGMVLDTLSKLFFGKPIGYGFGGFRGPNVSATTNYSYISQNRQMPSQSNVRTVKPSTPAYNDFVFASHTEAEAVLDNMVNAIDAYGRVSVNDLYDMCGITAPFTEVYWGWTNLSTATTARVAGGYTIVLPQPIRITP